MKRDEILNTALKATMGGRNTTHGDVVDNMNHVAAMWTAYLGLNKPLTGVDVAQMLTQLKISRAVHGSKNPDDFVDGAAYMAMAGEVMFHDKQPELPLGDKRKKLTIGAKVTLRELSGEWVIRAVFDNPLGKVYRLTKGGGYQTYVLYTQVIKVLS